MLAVDKAFLPLLLITLFLRIKVPAFADVPEINPPGLVFFYTCHTNSKVLNTA
jgi:hypothetical protein